MNNNADAMNHEEFLKWLDDYGACHEAIAWVAKAGHDLGAAWQQCTRGDWLLWWLEQAKGWSGLTSVTWWPRINEQYRDAFCRDGHVRSTTPIEHQAAADAIRKAVSLPEVLEAMQEETARA